MSSRSQFLRSCALPLDDDIVVLDPSTTLSVALSNVEGRGQERIAAMIDGLKLTMTGQELRQHLARRVDAYQRKAERLRQELKEPDPECPVPDHILESEMARAKDRAAGFEFMREHTVELEVYLLGKADLEFAEFLPEEEEDFIPCYMYRR